MAALTAGTGTLTGSSYGSLNTYDAFKIQQQFLKIAKRNLTFDAFGQNYTQEQGVGNEVRWRRYEKLSQKTTPMTEGVTPAYDQVQVTTIKATLQQFGGWIPTTDVQQAVATDPIIQQFTELQAVQAAETIDTITFNVVKAGTAVSYARSTGSTGRTDVNRTIGMTKGKTHASPGTNINTLIDVATRTLMANDTRMMTKMIAATPGFNTSPIHPAFVAVCHPDTKPDWELLVGWTPVEQYGAQRGILPGEIGSVGYVRVVTSTNAASFTDAGAAVSTDLLKSTGAVSNDVYPVIIFGEDAYGIVALAGYDAVVPKVVMPHPSPSSPLGQHGSVGWCTWHQASILQDLWMYRLEVAVSSLA